MPLLLRTGGTAGRILPRDAGGNAYDCGGGGCRLRCRFCRRARGGRRSLRLGGRSGLRRSLGPRLVGRYVLTLRMGAGGIGTVC